VGVSGYDSVDSHKDKGFGSRKVQIKCAS